MVLRRVTDLEGDLTGGQARCEEMEIADGEVLFIRRLGVVAMRDIEDVLRHILLDDKPGAAAKAHALALTDGMEPESLVLTDAPARL